ncbi:hypothetical protein VTI74DRAFT_10829 [Chaetomium olivicolor]
MAEGVTKFEQFVKFATDAYGLERLLRALQSLLQILLSTPSLHPLFLPLLFPALTAGSADYYSRQSALYVSSLQALRRKLGHMRQVFRLFRFLDSFSAAWAAWDALQATPAEGGGDGGDGSGGDFWVGAMTRVEKWADLGAKAFTGMYMLLESAAFVDVVLAEQVAGLRVWGEERAAEMAMDGQKFWFLGLVCAAVAGYSRWKLLAWKGRELNGDRRREGDKGRQEEKESEREMEENSKKANKVYRRLMADMMDLPVPGTVVGWMSLAPAKVGGFMLVSTVLTGMEVWERCGREVAAAKATAKAGRSS